MKSNIHYRFFKPLIILLLSLVLYGCDFAYPQGKLSVKNLDRIKVGSSTQVEIVHPNNGGTFVHDWKNNVVEVIEGEDLVEITGLNVKGIKEGKAKLKVSSTTVLSIEAYEDGKEDKVYSVFAEIEIVP